MQSLTCELNNQIQLIQIRKRLIALLNSIDPTSIERQELIVEGRALCEKHIALCGRSFEFDDDPCWEAAMSDH